MDNLWPGRVANRTVNLLNRHVERITTGGLRSSYLVAPEQRQRYRHVRDIKGRLLIDIEMLRGYVGIKGNIRGTTRWTDQDEFSVIFNEVLITSDRLLILAFDDPFDELRDPQEFKKFLKQNNISNRKLFASMAEKAMIVLQQELEKRGMVKMKKGEHELHGWDAIANYLGKSIPTVIGMAKDQKMKLPITLMGSTSYTTKEDLDRWKEDRLKKKPIWKEQKEEGK